MQKLAVTLIVALLVSCGSSPPPPPPAPAKFKLQEARIQDIQAALLGKQLTTVQLVDLYLARIKAYNGTCVAEPEGILGPIKTIKDAGQINALATLNLRPATLKARGFDERKARSMTDKADADPEHAGRAGNRSAAGRGIRQDREVSRSPARRGHVHQGSVRHLRPAHHLGCGCVLRQRSPAGRRHVRQAAARRGRDYSRQVEPRRIRLGHSAQLLRRHVLQSLRHRAQPVGLELGQRLLGRRESGDLRHRRGNRLVDSRPGARQQRGGPRSHAGTGEPRRHDRRRHSHARRARSAAPSKTSPRSWM